MNKDPNYVAALERAISEKYGEVAAVNPRANWNEEKEKKYLSEAKEKLKKESNTADSQEYIELGGVLIAKKLISSSKRSCEYCEKYSFSRNDDLFFTKYETCYSCYIKYIENREDRWKKGWRPNKPEQK